MEREELERYLFKEVELIQDVIRRMAYTSFMVKGWALTLVVVALLLKGGAAPGWVAFLPLVVFWYLDGYFLRQERLYRRLYHWVIEHRRESDEHLLDLNAARFLPDVASTGGTMVSRTLATYYGVLALLVLVVILVG